MEATKDSSTSGSKDFRHLHVGYSMGHLDPFHLDLESLTRGLVVVGQSGCGKSFFLGRLLEEMVLKGRRQDRFLVIDTNSDFRRGLKPALWEEFKKRRDTLVSHASRPDSEHVQGPLPGTNDDPPKFSDLAEEPKGVVPEEKRQWLEMEYHRDSKEAVVFGYDLRLSEHERAAVNTRAFDLDWQPLLDNRTTFLRCLPTWNRERVEYDWALSWALHNWEPGHREPEGGTLQAFCRYVWEMARSLRLSRSGVLSPETERGFAVELRDLCSSKEWREALSSETVGLPNALNNSGPRVDILETESLEDESARMRVVLRSLEQLWTIQMREHDEALESEKNLPDRSAWFILVEEAHRFAPERPSNSLVQRVSGLFQRIAAEGRKYGLYLILATQRPTKVVPGLLGECDNAVIMKMNSRADLEFLSKEMRILDVKLLEAALHFRGKGHALAIGEAAGAAPNVVQFVMAPRRSAEGGGDLVR